MYFDIAWYEITFKDSLQVPPIPQMVQQQSQNYQRHCLEYPSPDNKGCSGSSDIFVFSLVVILWNVNKLRISRVFLKVGENTREIKGREFMKFLTDLYHCARRGMCCDLWYFTSQYKIGYGWKIQWPQWTLQSFGRHWRRRNGTQSEYPQNGLLLSE